MAEIEEEKKKKKGGLLTGMLVALIAILMCTSVVFGWKLSTSEETVKVKNKDLQDGNAKYDRLMVDYKSTLELYESAKTGEESKDKELEAKKKELEEVFAKLKAFKDEGIGSAEDVKSLKAQLWKLRSELRDLKEKNAQLLADNEKLKADVQQKNATINGLEGDAKLTAAELAQTKAKASLGAKILGRDFQAEGVRQRRGGEKNTRNPRSVERLRMTFTLNENPIAKAGLKKIYLRAIAPDGTLLTAGGSTFPYQGAPLMYTDQLDIDYANTDKDVFMYASPYSHQFVSGKYTLEAYLDGNLIGTATVELK